jgi:hypothetical protein
MTDLAWLVAGLLIATLGALVAVERDRRKHLELSAQAHAVEIAKHKAMFEVLDRRVADDHRDINTLYNHTGARRERAEK